MKHPPTIRLYAEVPDAKKVDAVWLSRLAVRRGILDVAAYVSQYLQGAPGQCEAACFNIHWSRQYRCWGMAIDGGLCAKHVKIRNSAALKAAWEAILEADCSTLVDKVGFAIEAFDVGAADTIVIRVDVSESGYQRIAERAKAVFPGKQVVVVGMGTRIETWGRT